MEYPNLKFKVDPKKDIDVYIGFWESAKHYKDINKYLENCFYDLYTQIKYLKDRKYNTKKIQKIKIEEFVSEFYYKNEKVFKLQTQRAQRGWDKDKNKFFKLTDKIFKNQKWPKGEYFGYITIWGIFPRFLDNKTFCFPHKTKRKQFTLAVSLHEMLHFMFYDYAIKNHSKLFKGLNTEQGIFWELAEIFNAVMHKTEFLKIHGKKDYMVYPQHKKVLPYFIKLWQENKDIDVWLKKGYEYLNKNTND